MNGGPSQQARIMQAADADAMAVFTPREAQQAKLYAIRMAGDRAATGEPAGAIWDDYTATCNRIDAMTRRSCA